MTFGDTLRDGSSFGKLAILMAHLSLKFMLNISVSLSLPFGRGLRVTSRGSRVTGRGSRVTGRDSRVNGRRLRVYGRGSRVKMVEGRKILYNYFWNVVKSKFRVYSSFRFLFYFTLTPGGIMCRCNTRVNNIEY